MVYEQKSFIEERETQISIDYYTKTVVVYSNNSTVMNRMVRKGYTPTREFKEGSDVVACEWTFPMAELKHFATASLFR